MKKPTPTQVENPFGFDELFFSTTDMRGVITFGNDVFVRISGYSREKLMGAPHSIIRHPDMPRAVFKLLWDTIQAGQPIAAYVKNLAANGNFYWVFAFVFPIDSGYISIRLKPSSDYFKAAQVLYPPTLALENDSGMEASVPYLLEEIKKAGFKSYQDFMIQAAFAELKNIEFKRDQAHQAQLKGALLNISDLGAEATRELIECFQRVQGFQKTNKNLLRTMEGLQGGFQHLKFIALNMTVAAAKFGELAASLGVIAKEFSSLSSEIQSHLSGLSEFVHVLSEVVERCALIIAALHAQMSMVDFFIKESIGKLSSSESAFDDMVNNRPHFVKLFAAYVQNLSNEITKLEKDLHETLIKMNEVGKFTTGLEVIRQIGAVESARVNEVKQVFVHYLEEMQKFINLLRDSSRSIENEIVETQISCVSIKSMAHSLAGHVENIFELASGYSKSSS